MSRIITLRKVLVVIGASGRTRCSLTSQYARTLRFKTTGNAAVINLYTAETAPNDNWPDVLAVDDELLWRADGTDLFDLANFWASGTAGDEIEVTVHEVN